MSAIDQVDLHQKIIDGERPFEGEALKQLRDYYRIGLTWTSNALEGNTLTESETKIILEDGLTAGEGKPLRYVFEALGHGRAYDYMFSLLKAPSFGVKDILKMHKLFYANIDATNAGKLRRVSVYVSGSDYVFPPAKDVSHLMEKLGEWMAEEAPSLHPVRYAALLHLKLVTIHPFVDGNGRTARLAMNAALIRKGYMLAVVPPVCRAEYLALLRRAQQQKEDEPFVEFVAERVLQTQREIMRLLHLMMPDSKGSSKGEDDRCHGSN